MNGTKPAGALPPEVAEPIAVQAVALPRLSDELAILREAERETGVPFLTILDTPAGDSSVAQAAAQVADLAVVPCRPAQVDLLSLDYTLRLCKLVGVPCYGVINAAKPYGEHTSAARAVLLELGVVTAPTELGDRVAFQHSFRQGRGVTETEPQSKAAVELELLYAWLMKQWAAESTITSRSTS